MKISLIVTTYNRPDALELVLMSAARQSRPPNELVVADDGSGPETARLVERFARELPFPVIHAWQEDRGFRAARSRNNAIARTTGDYVITLDGDMVMHPRFVEDHARAARPSVLVQGFRIRMSPELTERLLREKRTRVGWPQPGIRWHFYAVRSRLVSLLTPPRKCTIGSGNQGVWRTDLVRVNGYNDRMCGWGGEDDELVARLKNAGVSVRCLRNLALAYHLYHEERSQRHRAENRQTALEVVRSGAVWCDEGLDQHSP